MATGDDQEGRLLAFHFTSWLTGTIESDKLPNYHAFSICLVSWVVAYHITQNARGLDYCGHHPRPGRPGEERA